MNKSLKRGPMRDRKSETPRFKVLPLPHCYIDGTGVFMGD